jgi:hypothetical protein
MRKARIEYEWSGLAQRADLTADMLTRQQRSVMALVLLAIMLSRATWERAMTRLVRIVGIVVVAALATMFAIYWRTFIFVSMVLLYTAWHRLFG